MRVWLAWRVERLGLRLQSAGAALVRFAPVVAYGRGTREVFKRVMEWDA